MLLHLGLAAVLNAAAVPVDRSNVDPGSRTRFEVEGDRVRLQWPTGAGQGELTLRIGAERPLIEAISLTRPDGKLLLLEDADPAYFLTVGSRQGTRSDGWVVFFDRVNRRPYQTHPVQLDAKQVRLSSSRGRAVIEIDKLSAGSFQGRLEFRVFAGSPLIKVVAVLQTSEDRRAILYDAGLVAAADRWQQIGWLDTDGAPQLADADALRSEPPLATRHRTVVASRTGGGSIAVFPPPHQFLYPLDFSTNLQFNWAGSGFHGEPRFGVGIRQHPEGDQRFVPWFNAPPKSQQRLAMFLLVSHDDSAGALRQVLKYTRGDRFKPLPGYRTFTSHYHVAHTMDVMRRRDAGLPTDDVPEFVTVFRNMGVDIAHLAEFHGDGNPRDTGDQRLRQLDLMHRECERLSDERFLLLPGEEPNVHLGGHWISFFPHPVNWIMSREPQQPFVQEHPQYGRVYRVGGAEEMRRLLTREQGLAWTAHPRIKSSHGYPDQHRRESFFLSDRFLGAAWKAMPADLSRDRLGWRALDLMDDMANWSVSDPRQSAKYVLGEVDVFKIDHTHELYGHMNINYLQLDELPRLADGWQPVLDALRRGRFFVTTGEVLIPRFTINGQQSGETLQLAGDERPQLAAQIEGTFPLSFAEVISGDGRTVYRQRIDLSDSPQFDRRTLRLSVNLSGRRWARLEVWDIAANGAFTQPVWLRPGD